MYFGHKHVETGLNCSNELSTFLEYHIPLTYFLLYFFSYCIQCIKTQIFSVMSTIYFESSISDNWFKTYRLKLPLNQEHWTRQLDL